MRPYRIYRFERALSLFCGREIARKDFPFVRDLTASTLPPSPRSTRSRSARSQPAAFIAEVVMLLGPPGVGKMHLAVAIGHQAILAGCGAACQGARRGQR
jgi:hypothetical protein